MAHADDDNGVVFVVVRVVMAVATNFRNRNELISKETACDKIKPLLLLLFFLEEKYLMMIIMIAVCHSLVVVSW